MLRFLIVDDHPLMREALTSTLESRYQGRCAVVSCASLADAIVRLGEAQRYDLCLLDLGLPDSQDLDTLRRVRAMRPAMKVAVITGQHDARIAADVIREGGQGFIPKSFAPRELYRAIESVLDGVLFYPRVSDTSGTGAPASSHPVAGDAPTRRYGNQTAPARELPALTARQRDVLRLLQRGLANKVIAWELGLAEKTVKIHLSAIYRAYRVRSRAQLLVALSGLHAIGADTDPSGRVAG